MLEQGDMLVGCGVEDDLRPVRGNWDDGEWHHLAVAWDRNRGIRVYQDGRPAASNWGEYGWDWNLVPMQLFLGTRRASSYPQPRPGTVVDDFRVYSAPLTAEQIARLARGEPPRGDVIEPPPVAEIRSRELQRRGWSGEGFQAVPRVAGGQAVTLSFCRILRCIDAKRPQSAVFDGLPNTTWPKIYYGSFTKGRRMDVELTTDASFDRLRLFVTRPYAGTFRVDGDE